MNLLVYFTFSCLFSVLICSCSFWACSSDLSISSQMLSSSISNILRNLYGLFLNLVITFVGLKIISFLWCPVLYKIKFIFYLLNLFGVGALWWLHYLETYGSLPLLISAEFFPPCFFSLCTMLSWIFFIMLPDIVFAKFIVWIILFEA